MRRIPAIPPTDRACPSGARAATTTTPATANKHPSGKRRDPGWPSCRELQRLCRHGRLHRRDRPLRTRRWCRSSVRRRTRRRSWPPSRARRVRTASDNVMCLTCHRAHASAFNNITRWDMEDEFLAEGYPTAANLVAHGCRRHRRLLRARHRDRLWRLTSDRSATSAT